MSAEKVNFSILGKQVEGVEDWQGMTLQASFDDFSEGATITSESFLLVRDARDVVWNDILSGNIFIGRDFTIQIKDRFSNNITAFSGLINDQLEFINKNQKGIPSKIGARIQKNNSIDDLRRSLDGTTFGFLQGKGVITTSNGVFVDIITVDPEAAQKLFVIAMLGTLTVIQIAKQVEELSKDIAIFIGIVGAGVGGPVTAPIFAGLAVLATSAFLAVLLVSYINLADQAFALLLPKLRRQKALSYRELLTLSLGYFGYSLNSNITELDTYHFIPSNPNGENSISIGTPNAGDFGYNVGQFFNYILSLFYAKSSVVGKEVIIRNRDDSYWKKNSSVKLKDVKPESEIYNTTDLIANRTYSFSYDIMNEYSITDRKDAIYEVITSQSPELTSLGKDMIKGSEEVNWNYSLVSRKEGLTNVESGLLGLAGVLDGAIKTFGGKSNYKARVKQRDGAIKTSQTTTSQASVAPIINGKLPSNHKEILSAEYIEKKFHYSKSFVRNNFIGQKKIVTLSNVPFTLDDFVKTTNTGVLQNANGQFVEIDSEGTSLEWEVATQTATITYREPFIYTRKLKEIEIRNA